VNHIVMYSGGIGSWSAARRVAEKHGTDNLTLLFADTLMEDEDLYRFLDESVQSIGVPVTRIADGRDIWQVFKDVRFLGNSRLARCSHDLKQKVSRKWLEERYKPEEVTLYLGIDWTEEHRYERSRTHWLPWQVQAPLCEAPYIDKGQMLFDLRDSGIKIPRLYEMGFAHNNCGGGCVKAGIAHWLHLLKVMPERYAVWEGKEQEIRDFLGKDVSILRDRTKAAKCRECAGAGMQGQFICGDCDGTGKASRPMTLRELRENTPLQVDMFDFGGCGCFSDEGAGE
jgi:hypothetical protein